MLEHVNMHYGGGSGGKDVSMHVHVLLVSTAFQVYFVAASIVVTSNTICGIAEKPPIFSPSRCKFSNHTLNKGSAEGSREIILILARA